MRFLFHNKPISRQFIETHFDANEIEKQKSSMWNLKMLYLIVVCLAAVPIRAEGAPLPELPEDTNQTKNITATNTTTTMIPFTTSVTTKVIDTINNDMSISNNNQPANSSDQISFVTASSLSSSEQIETNQTFSATTTTTTEASKQIISAASIPISRAFIVQKLPEVLQRHNLNENSTLRDVKPELSNVTRFDTCYERGIVGKDSTLDIFDESQTIAQTVQIYFSKLPSQINERNAEIRIGALIHSIILIANEVIECDREDKRDPIGLTPLSCLTMEEQNTIIG